MKNTFTRRVAAERKVLSAVNRITSGNQQLTGLSSGAIECWRQTAQIPSVDKSAEILVSLSRLCQLLSNRSGENFDSIEPTVIEKFDALLHELKTTIDPR